LADDWPEGAGTRPQWIVLLVRKENTKAIRLYENCGFELIPGVERSNNHVVMKL
jgi:ribosomal protein S18 acetylase RimI-like enzyme